MKGLVDKDPVDCGATRLLRSSPVDDSTARSWTACGFGGNSNRAGKSMFFSSNALLNPDGGSRKVFHLEGRFWMSLGPKQCGDQKSPTVSVEQKLRPPYLTWGGTLVRMCNF